MNRLNAETSPYLRQHKDNPIHWQGWSKEAFELAKSEQKPVFLSIGYSTCHWCHVMAHECFEDQEVAKYLNTRFVSIKVDREERPDVDEIYMKSLIAMTGGGGWPMSVWLTPDGVPFFAGTYFPKNRFLQLLNRVDQLWTQEKGALIADGEKLLNAMKQDLVMEKNGEILNQSADFYAPYLSHFQYMYDERHGGFGEAPKFPQTMNLRVLMRVDAHTKLNQSQTLVCHTLSEMSRGGMYDHVAGGFHRYSVDKKWLVPHFEKMLYDQAMIVSALLEARALYRSEEFETVIRETLDYVLSEMTAKEGGFFAAQDADSLNPVTSHSEEGFFATYSFKELEQNLSAAELEFITRVYGITQEGHLDGRNILHLQEGFDRSVKKDPLWASSMRKLKNIRAAKPQPHLDDKIIAAWNGWMISSFAIAAAQLNEPRYLEAAQKALAFAKHNLWSSGELARYSRSGKTKGSATSEDFASLISACLDLYQTDFNPEWAKFALELQSAMDAKFWDAENGGYFTSDGTDLLLPMRAKDSHDGVHPCANSMAAYNLVRLHALTGNSEYKSRFAEIASLFAPLATDSPGRLSYMNLALDLFHQGIKVVVLGKGDWPQEFLAKSRAKFKPHVFWALGGEVWPVTKGKAEAEAIFVCEEGRCLAPAKNIADANQQIDF